MNLRNLLTNDNAVSPVIGVILMVAITVILAAVIGTFVLGLGQNVQSTAPQASFSFDQDGNKDVTVSHDGGDTIAYSNIKVTVNGNTAYATDGGSAFWDKDGKVNAGDSKTITDFENNDDNPTDGLDTGDTIRVIWTSDSGENSQVLSKYTVA